MEYTDKNLFAPTSNRDLRKQYPELKDVPEFTNLTPKEMRFVYYYCAYYKDGVKNNRERIVKAVKKSLAEVLSEKEKVEYHNGNFPNNVRLAIARWDKFDLSVRLKAKVTVDKIFDNIQNMIDVDMDKDFLDKDGKTDFNKKKQYVDTSITIAESFPKLIKMQEEGFGITDTAQDAENKKSGDTLFEEWHSEQEQNNN